MKATYNHTRADSHLEPCQICEALQDRDDLLAALKLASEHLDYCGYGDSYERECAMDAKLPELIANAITKAECHL
jgi:hypothetical protein